MDRLEFKGYYGCDSACAITRYGENVFVIIDDEYDKGTSITNAIEMVASQIVRVYNVPTEKLILIEELPKLKCRYSLVDFTLRNSYIHEQEVYFSDPLWKYLSEDEFQRITCDATQKSEV